ncbi:MAG: hypothetical protein GY696_36610 [Gammaproteobacteria bacterium]|nr:hypothetical protein [Gammaproteobacteria bacterium]
MTAMRPWSKSSSKVTIGHTPIIIELDTGAKPTTISLETYKKHFSKIRLSKSNGTYRNYDG